MAWPRPAKTIAPGLRTPVPASRRQTPAARSGFTSPRAPASGCRAEARRRSKRSRRMSGNLENPRGAQSVPADAGIGLRAPHHLQVLSESPDVPWFEAHSENYFADGGSHVECLSRIRERYPLSLHGVGLSLGSTDPLDRQHLANLERVIA